MSYLNVLDGVAEHAECLSRKVRSWTRQAKTITQSQEKVKKEGKFSQWHMRAAAAADHGSTWNSFFVHYVLYCPSIPVLSSILHYLLASNVWASGVLGRPHSLLGMCHFAKTGPWAPNGRFRVLFILWLRGREEGTGGGRVKVCLLAVHHIWQTV